MPHALSDAWKNPEAKDPLNQRYGWVKAGNPGEDMWRAIGRGRATTWTIKINMDGPSKGVATLRVALAGADGRRAIEPGTFEIAVGGKQPGFTGAADASTTGVVSAALTLQGAARPVE